MKKLLFGALTVLFSATVVLAASNTPFEPAVNDRFRGVEGLRSKSFDFLVPSGGLAQGTYKIGELPANSIYTKGYISFPSQFSHPAGVVVALGCGTASNILAASALSGNTGGSIIQLPTKTTGVLIGSNVAPCDLNLVVSGTAGKGLVEGHLKLALQWLKN